MPSSPAPPRRTRRADPRAARAALAAAAALAATAGIAVGASESGSDASSRAEAAAPVQLDCSVNACVGARAGWPRHCSRKVTSLGAAREAVERAKGGKKVCLGPGTFGDLDLTGIRKPPRNRVTLQGAPGRRTSTDQISFGGATGLVIDGFRIRSGVDSANQEVTHHVTIRRNDIGGTPGSPNDGDDAIRAIGDWSSDGQYAIRVVRNRIHDTSGYGIRAQGNAPGWTVQRNRFERIGDADYIQTGMPANWVVDRNWFVGPSFRTSEGAHPDLWQSLDPNPPGTSIAFTRNRVQHTDGLTIGFIFGDVATDDGPYHRIRILNNLFNRPADGETCQLSNSIGLRFERNTIRAGENGWACRFGETDNAPASNYSIKRNVFTESEVSRRGGPGHVSCGPDSNSCAAFRRGAAKNVSDDGSAPGPGSIKRWRPKWSRDGWFRARKLRFRAGHKLRRAKYRGWPFSG